MSASKLQRYDLGEELGSGAFSVVRRAIDKITKEEVAVKIVRRRDMNEIDPKQAEHLQTEVQVLSSVSHPNIISLREIIEVEDTIYIVTELVDGGELFERLMNQGAYEEKDARDIVRQIVSAIEYLHSEGVTHRDLKPENLLLATKNGKDVVKVADFGLSKIIDEGQMVTACGTPAYVAPEVLMASGYGPEVDMWSIGVITYIILCGYPPFYGENVSEIFDLISNVNYDFPEEDWESVSSEAKDFIERLLVFDPKKRMTAAEALKHPWFKSGKGQLLRHASSRLITYVADHRKRSSANLRK